MESIYVSTTTPPVLARLSKSDCTAYVERIALPSSTASQPASLELLSTLLLAHHLALPYDVSNLHLKSTDWLGPSKPVTMGSGDGMPLGKELFERVVLRRQGSSYCYGLNTLFSSLLRGLGFSVSEVGARVFMHRGKDPKVTGWLFSAITHETLIVSWEGSAGKRYLVDVGFGGGGCAYPILLQDGATSKSLSDTESFYLKQEVLPVDNGIHEDAALGYTLYRRVLPPGVTASSPETAATGPGYWTACYHFTLSTLCPIDIDMANFFNCTSPNATWMNFFACTLLQPDGGRKTLTYNSPPKDSSLGDPFADADTGGRRAKLYTKKGIAYDEENVRWIKFETEDIRKVMESDFGFNFE